MANEAAKDRKLAALCKRMGNLWSAKLFKTVEEEIPETKLKECHLTLLGKLYSRPNVNFQAFFSTMKRAWKVENISSEPLQPGLFAFTFRSEADKQKVLNASPWSFSNNLLILQQLDPYIPIHCHVFTHCSFWVHVYGLPLARITVKIMTEVASSLGDLIELKIATKEGSPCKVGKARISLNLASPLIPGMLMQFGEDHVWLDFKYERLPFYCYSCGCIGHYAADCKVIPYVESDFEVTIPGNFGYWLRAEEREHSPLWKLFYGPDEITLSDEEIIPETPIQTTQEELSSARVPAMPLIEAPPPPDKGKGLMDLSTVGETDQGTQLMLTEFPWTDFTIPKGADSPKYSRKIQKGTLSKKKRRHNPYSANVVECESFDEAHLLDTPIEEVEGNLIWAMVAGPKKPPGYP